MEERRCEREPEELLVALKLEEGVMTQGMWVASGPVTVFFFLFQKSFIKLLSEMSKGLTYRYIYKNTHWLRLLFIICLPPS